MGRVKSPKPCGLRKYLPMPDGATATFDLFEPQGVHITGGEPGFLNSKGIFDLKRNLDLKIYTELSYGLKRLGYYSQIIFLCCILAFLDLHSLSFSSTYGVYD